MVPTKSQIDDDWGFMARQPLRLNVPIESPVECGGTAEVPRGGPECLSTNAITGADLPYQTKNENVNK